MSTSQPSAATPAPAPAGREPARADRDSAEAPAAKESLYAHARRSLKTAARAAATAVQSAVRRATTPALDAGIVLLQSLRKRVVGTQGDDKATSDGGSGSRKDRPGGRRDDAAPEASAPRRRLGPFLVYLGILLAGGMGGGALAYHLLEERLSHQTAENVPAAVVKSDKPVPVAATSKNPEAEQTDNADAEKQLEEAQAKLEEMQGKLEEVQEKLEETQTARVNADKKLAAALAGYTKSAAEKQKKLDETEKRLAMLSAERAGSGQRPSLASRDSAARRHLVKAGNCDLGTGNVDALKDCLRDFNR